VGCAAVSIAEAWRGHDRDGSMPMEAEGSQSSRQAGKRM
jgi:hypothetical protein